MQVDKVTNIGLTMSDGTVVPVIRAVVSNYAGNITRAQLEDIMLDIYNKSTGCVTACGYWAVGITSEYINLDEQVTDYGGENGFKLRVRVQNHYDSLNLQDEQIIRCYLYYDNHLISEAYVYTGYSTYETAYLIIFTDEDYNLITYQDDQIIGFQIRSDHNIGTGIRGEIPVCGVWEDGTLAVLGQGDRYIPATPGPNIKDDINSEIIPEPDEDPYNPGHNDSTQPGGGDGNHNLDSDDIDIPALPTLSATDTGFITIFNPSLAQLQALSDYLWSALFDVDTVKRLFADPMDVFLGLSIVPVAVPSGGSKTVKVAGISTGISMTVAARQYIEVDCGSINVSEYWGAYLDYEPFTTAQLYLPYVGTHQIAIDDIMGKTVKVVYHVDILSGSCIAYVKCGSSVLYSFIGQCSSSIPITANDWTNVINGALNIASAIGTMISSGGASAPSAAGTIASTAVNSLKPSIEKSGSLSGTGGMMAIQKPYLIITRPKQAIPSNQNKYMGYPSFITTGLGAISGYTEVEDIHITGINACDEEIAEIEELLKGGVIL